MCRLASTSIREQFPSINPGSKICDSCRKKSYKRTEADSKSSGNILFTSSDEGINDSFDHDALNSESDSQTSAENLREIIDGLKEKFSSLPSNDSDRITILTVLPSN